MLSCHQKDIAEAFRGKMSGLGGHLLDLKCYAKNCVVTGEAAVGAVVDTLIGEVEGRKDAHGAAKVTPGQRSGTTGHLLKGSIPARLQQPLKSTQLRRRGNKDRINTSGEGHGEILMKNEEGKMKK